MPDRFYCAGFRLGQPAAIEGDEARHLARVRRVAVGAEVEIFDGRGGAATAEVVRIGRDRVDLLPRHAVAGSPPTPISVTLATAIPKGDRFDWLIEKATELGVARVVPLVTERSTVDPRSAKLDRLRRAIIEACKQCRRDTLMILDEPEPWTDWLHRGPSAASRRWIAHPGGRTDWATTPLVGGVEIVAAIGPEGGFTAHEITSAQAAGWEAVHLTATILRVETAALAIAASLLVRGGAADA